MSAPVLVRPVGPNPSGLCHCGCGQRTPLASRTRRRTRAVRGLPLRFISGHNTTSARGRRDVGEPDATSTRRRCARPGCDWPLVTCREGRRAGHRVHGGRGLCQQCAKELRGTDELLDYERKTRTRGEVLDEWHAQRLAGVTLTEAASRMGMSLDALELALRRQRRDHPDDERAQLGRRS